MKSSNLFLTRVVMLTLLLIPSICAAQWSSAISEQLTSGPDNDVVYRNSIAIDDFGTLHIVYDRYDSTDHNLYYQQKPAGEGWTTPEPIGNQDLLLGSPWIDVHAATGTPYICFYEGQQLKLAIRYGAEWTYFDIDLPADYSCGNPAMTVDDNGRAHFVLNANNELTNLWCTVYCYWDGTDDIHFQDLGTILEECGLTSQTDLAVRSDGSVAIMERNCYRFVVMRNEVMVNDGLGSTHWTTHVVEEPGLSCYPSSIAVADNDDVHYIFFTNMMWPFPSEVYYSKLAAGASQFTTPELISDTLNAAHARLDVDDDGFVHVIAHEMQGMYCTGDLYYITNLNGSWEHSPLLEGECYDPTIVMDSEGNGNVLYRHQIVHMEDNDIHYYGFADAPDIPTLTVLLAPESQPVVIPASGGNFSYNVDILNAGTSAETFDAWGEVTLPTGSSYGPLFLRESLALSPEESLNRNMVQSVPGTTPEGLYIYRIKIGQYPDVVTHSDEFFVMKEGVSEGDQNESWVVNGWQDPGSDATWDLLLNLDVGAICNDTDIQAAIYVDPFFFVAGACSGSDTNKVYVLNQDGSYFGEFLQWNSSANGWQDFAFDGNYLYACQSNILWAFDLTGNPVHSMDLQMSFSQVEAVTYDPIIDGFWVMSYGELFIVERNGLAATVAVPYMNCTGMAWDDTAPGGPYIWFLGQNFVDESYVQQFDPINRTLTPVYQTIPVLPGMTSQSPNGAFFSADWDPNVSVVGSIAMGDPSDHLFCLELYPTGGQPNIDVDVTYVSGSPVPAGGGNLYFDVWVENLDTQAYDFDAWLEVAYEGNQPWTVIQRALVNYQPGWTINRPGMYFPVPGMYAPGQYTMTGKVGLEPDVAWDESGFEWELLGGDVVEGFIPFTPEEPFPNPFGEAAGGGGENGLIRPEFVLHEAYPNPFNPTTNFSFSIPQAEHVTLKVFNLQGQLVETLVDGLRDAGSHNVTFDASALSSGIYLYQLTAGQNTASGKMVLVK